MGRNLTWGTCVAAAAVVGLLTACDTGSSASVTSPGGSSTTPPATSPSSTATPSTSESVSSSPTSPTLSAAPSGSSDIVAKIAAGAPPKDLVWQFPPVPSHWKKLKTETGSLQWQTGDGCGVLLQQPAGIGTGRSPNSQEVLDRTAKRTSTAFPGKPAPKYVSRASHKARNLVDGLSGTAVIVMPEAIVDYGKVRTEHLAYRNGDYALTYTSFCRDAASFAKASKSDFNTFRDTLQVKTTY